MLQVFCSAALRVCNRSGIAVAIVSAPNTERETNLLEIVDAADFLSLALGGGEGRQQHGRENCDDRNNDEEFDERKRFFVLLFHNVSLVNSGVEPTNLPKLASLSTGFWNTLAMPMPRMKTSKNLGNLRCHWAGTGSAREILTRHA